jgi:hypothetical protein
MKVEIQGVIYDDVAIHTAMRAPVPFPGNGYQTTKHQVRLPWRTAQDYCIAQTNLNVFKCGDVKVPIATLQNGDTFRILYT